MKRFASVWALALACCSVGLIGADSNSFPTPTVVVYPITATGPTPAEAGGNVALLLATKIGQLGKVTVKAATPGTERADYLKAASSQGADYYIAGYMTPVGNDVSLILQLVSTQSGSIIYSVSATVQTYSDVVAQADSLNEAMVRHEERGLPSVQEVSAATTPPPVAGHQGINLTNALGRKPRAPQGPPLAFAGLVINVSGSATPEQLTYAQEAIAATLRSGGLNGEILPISLDDAQHNGPALCKANPTSVAFFSGTLVNDGSKVDLAVAAQGCDGTAIGKQHSSQTIGGRGGISAAIDRAATADAVAFAPLVKPLTVAAKP